MTIYELIEKYGKGKGEAVMIESTRILSDVLEPMKEKEPKKYWLALRKLYGAMSGCHYNEEFAMHDVADMEYTDKEGNEHKGGYWTVDQIEEATKNKNFPSGCTRWDKYVAFNAFGPICARFWMERILSKRRMPFGLTMKIGCREIIKYGLICA